MVIQLANRNDLVSPPCYDLEMRDWSEQQKLGFALTGWLLDAGAGVARKGQALGGVEALTPIERLLYELWIFDMEQQNGGVSQYFCNQPIQEWNRVSSLARPALPSFNVFASTVESVVGQSVDPYESVVDSSVNLDDLYEDIRVPLLLELQSLVQRPADRSENSAPEP
jgi:hypothetical protein